VLPASTAILLAPSARLFIDRLRSHELATGNQVVILTMDRIDREDSEEFAVRAFEAGKP
jgi:hypothetical protein